MTTSGQYSFSPALSLLVKQAYGRIGIRGPQIVAEHMKDAEVESNLLLCAWSSDQPNLAVGIDLSLPRSRDGNLHAPG